MYSIFTTSADHLLKPRSGDTRLLEKGVDWIFCCQPSYGLAVQESVTVFSSGSGGRTAGHAIKAIGGASLLAWGFNGFWLDCLNYLESGAKISHFAMLHDDVVPEAGWLDKMIGALLEAQEDDPKVKVMSAVIPLKDWQRMTSTAIDGNHPPGDPCPQPVYQLSVPRVEQLPEIFGASDLDQPEGKLLVNTGLMVVDVSGGWWSAEDERGDLRVFFTVKDRCRRSPVIVQRGKPRPLVRQVAPEDWTFSRMVQSLGLRVRATRRINLSHVGKAAYDGPHGNLPPVADVPGLESVSLERRLSGG